VEIVEGIDLSSDGGLLSIPSGTNDHSPAPSSPEKDSFGPTVADPDSSGLLIITPNQMVDDRLVEPGWTSEEVVNRVVNPKYWTRVVSLLVS
jgi:hypothetical protein